MIFQAIETSEGGIPHRAFVVGIMGVLKFGNAWAALRIMRRMEEHRLSVPNQCLVSLFRLGCEGTSRDATALLDQALTLNTPPPPDALFVIAKCAEEREDLDLAERVAALSPGVSKALVPVLALFAKQQSSRATELLEERPGGKGSLTPDLCLDVLSVCSAYPYAPLVRAMLEACDEGKFFDKANQHAPRLLKTAHAAA